MNLANLPATAVKCGGRFGMTPEYVSKMPLSEQARQDLLRIYSKDQPDYMPGQTSAEKKLKDARTKYTKTREALAKAQKSITDAKARLAAAQELWES